MSKLMSESYRDDNNLFLKKLLSQVAWRGSLVGKSVWNDDMNANPSIQIKNPHIVGYVCNIKIGERRQEDPAHLLVCQPHPVASS